MLDLNNHVIFADGPDDDTVLAMPRDVAEIVFHEAFALSANPRLTYADFVAKQQMLEGLLRAPISSDTPTMDDLLALMTAETRIIKKSALTTQREL